MFSDERGEIQDLGGGWTWIRTVKGAVRGNHVHRYTDQTTYVTSGLLLTVDDAGQTVLGPGESIHHPAGTPHAWKALSDATCMVFTEGPRATDYESDTHRLKEPLCK